MTSTTTTSTAENPIARVEQAFTTATGEWTDMTWDGLGAVVDALDRAAEKSEQALDRAWDRVQADGLTSWFIGQGPASTEYQDHRRRLRDAVADRDLADLRELAAEEEADVEAAAERAQEWAEIATAAARAGKWNEAVAAARKAAGIERTYGDAPTWGPFEAACEAAHVEVVSAAECVSAAIEVNEQLTHRGFDTLTAADLRGMAESNEMLDTLIDDLHDVSPLPSEDGHPVLRSFRAELRSALREWLRAEADKREAEATAGVA